MSTSFTAREGKNSESELLILSSSLDTSCGDGVCPEGAQKEVQKPGANPKIQVFLA